MKKEIREKWFKYHVANYTVINDELKILEWKKPNTLSGNIRYVFDKHNLYITGDYYSAMYSLNEIANLESLAKYDLYYFNSKCIMTQQPATEFSSKVAELDLKNQFKDVFDVLLECECEFTDEECEEYEINDDNRHEFCECSFRYNDSETVEKRELLKELISGAKSCSSSEGWTEFVRGIDERLIVIDCEYYNWVFDIGIKPTPYTQAYLIGLKMAYEQLSEAHSA